MSGLAIPRTHKSSQCSIIFATFILGRLRVKSRLGKRTWGHVCLALVLRFWSACVYLRMWLSCFSVRALCFLYFLCLFLGFLPCFLASHPHLSFSFVLFLIGGFVSFYSASPRLRPSSRNAYCPLFLAQIFPGSSPIHCVSICATQRMCPLCP